MPNRNRSGIRRIFTLNIGTVIFGIIFIYLIITLLMYLTATHVTTYQVTAGPLANNQTFTGLAVRSEQVVTADTSGYINYYARENEKIRSGGAVYGTSPTKKVETYTELTSDTLAEISNNISQFAYSFDSSDFHDVYSFRYCIDGMILDNSLRAANIPYNGINSVTIGTETICKASQEGIVSYLVDGFEDFDLSDVTKDALDEKSHSPVNLKNDDMISAGDNVYKLITSDEWYIVIPLTAKQIVKLDNVNTIRVKFLKDGVTQNASISIQTLPDGSYYGILSMTSGLIRYVDERYIDIELVTNTQAGLKIPVSSIVSKSFFTIPEEYATYGGDGSDPGFLKVTTDKNNVETTVFTSTTLYEHKNGKYYIDSSSFSKGDVIIKEGSTTDRYILKDTANLEGVYCINKGYAQFRKISIIDKNEDYCIVEKGTAYGIAQFDNIVLDASKVSESQITAAG